MPVIEGTSRLKEASGEYDFAVDGGAIGSFTLRSAGGATLGNSIPSGSVITGGYVEVDTAVTSGGTPAVAIQVEGVADLVASGTLAAAGLSSTGRKSIVPVFTGATTVKTTTARAIVFTVATAALTAGKFRVVLWYR